MSDLAIPSKLPAHLKNVETNASLAVSAGNGVATPALSIRGKNFIVQEGDEETTLKNADGDPLQRIRVAIINARANESKAYYPGKFKPGVKTDPACFSLDGIRPNPGVPDPQSDSCATCKHNVYGTSGTGRGKLCPDKKKLILVPVDQKGNGDADLAKWNGELKGFALMLPAASFKAYNKHLQALAHNNLPLEATVTELSFADVTHPQLQFAYAGLLTAEAYAEVEELNESEAVLKAISSEPIDLSDREEPEPAPKKKKKQVEDPELPVEDPEAAMTNW